MTTNYITEIELVQKGDSSTINIGEPKYIEITYGELVDSKTRGKLIPGAWYYIEDYCEDFGILTLAIDDSRISEDCKAISKNNAYNCDAWKIWYTLDNYDGTTVNYTGTIYRMIDEWNNDCPYDFKNIKTFFNSDGSYKDFNDGSVINNTIIQPHIMDIYSMYSNNNNNISIYSDVNIIGNTFDSNCSDIVLRNEEYGNICFIHVSNVNPHTTNMNISPVEIIITNDIIQNESIHIEPDQYGTSDDGLIAWYV